MPHKNSSAPICTGAPPLDLRGAGWSELEACAELNSPGRADVARPLTEAGRAYIRVESIASRNGEIAVVDEHMLIEGVVKFGAEYKTESLIKPRVLRNRKVHVLVVWSAETKNARTGSSVAKYPLARGARSKRLERGQGFKCCWIEEQALVGIKVIRILQEGFLSWNEPWQAPLRCVGGQARSRADPHRGAFGVANDRTYLPTADNAVETIASR